ncbi:MAG: ABC transporter ATP-binding protein [Methanomicrobiales archaeon]
MIAFDRVSLTLGAFSLRDVSFRIDEGEYFFIIGPSGAGKTVILEAIAGLHTPDSGRVRIRDDDVLRRPPEQRNLSLVYQDYSLFPHMTVEKNIAFGLKMRHRKKTEITRRVDELIGSFHLEGIRHRHPLTLSGGEQQRVAIARALAVNPEILLLDEPLSALDPLTREQVIGDLRRIHREHGLTIVQVTHSRGEAMRLATRVAVIIDGCLATEGPVQEVFNAPRTKEVARFVGYDNVLDGIVRGNTDRVAVIGINGHQVTAVTHHTAGETVSVCIRAEDVMIGTGEISARNRFRCRIEAVTPEGPLVQLVLNCGFRLIATVLRDTAEEMGLEPGAEVDASFKATAVHVCE